MIIAPFPSPLVARESGVFPEIVGSSTTTGSSATSLTLSYPGSGTAGDIAIAFSVMNMAGWTYPTITPTPDGSGGSGRDPEPTASVDYWITASAGGGSRTFDWGANATYSKRASFLRIKNYSTHQRSGLSSHESASVNLGSMNLSKPSLVIAAILLGAAKPISSYPGTSIRIDGGAAGIILLNLGQKNAGLNPLGTVAFSNTNPCKVSLWAFHKS